MVKIVTIASSNGKTTSLFLNFKLNFLRLLCMYAHLHAYMHRSDVQVAVRGCVEELVLLLPCGCWGPTLVGSLAVAPAIFIAEFLSPSQGFSVT